MPLSNAQRLYKGNFSRLILSPCLAQAFGCSLSLHMAQAHVCFASNTVSPDILPSVTQASKLAPFQTAKSRSLSWWTRRREEGEDSKARWTVHVCPHIFLIYYILFHGVHMYVCVSLHTYVCMWVGIQVLRFTCGGRGGGGATCGLLLPSCYHMDPGN